MNTILNYIVESSVGLGILSLIYRFFLRKSQVLWFNRTYILSVVVFAAFLPFIHLQLPEEELSGNLLPAVIVGGGYYMLEAITVFGEGTRKLAVSSLEIFRWIPLLYILGFGLLIARFLLSFFHLYNFRKKATIEKHKNFILVDTHKKENPFSFFRFLFLNKTAYNGEELNTIINHELIHIQLKHSFDILLLELILIIQWFNPFIWILRRDLKEVHEFQADRKTLETGINPGFYKEMLLNEALGIRFALGNNLNKSLIKKRLKMMNNKINKSIGYFKPALAVISLVALLIAFACEKQDDKVYDKVEVMPEYPGGIEALSGYISENVVYPEKALNEQTQGKVFVSFVVSKEGKVIDAQVVRGISDELDNEALRVVSTIPDWTPAKNDGKNVSVKFTFPINFTLPEPQEEVFFVVEDMPQFPGGIMAMRQYIAKNVKYPEKAKTDGTEGQVFVSFVVSENGKVVQAKIERSVSNELDAEAVRVVESMPDWTPGYQAGKAIPVSYTIPINFSLGDKGGTIVIDEAEVNKDAMKIQIEYLDRDGSIVAQGKVVDADGKPIAGAHIVVANGTVGTGTDAGGNFSFELPDDALELVVSYVGKETQKVAVKR
ncbi:MAG: TonB family protein [Bacteroidales bacterium]|nr:TonB family protein [Bacteroidales bacterium]MBN2817413.1 TonB family protein [Bacteroidales bacterium]